MRREDWGNKLSKKYETKSQLVGSPLNQHEESQQKLL